MEKPSTIALTDNIRNYIKSGRKSVQLRGDTLSTMIGRGKSYISFIETGRLSEIAYEDLVSIISHIFSIKKSDAEKRLEQILSSNGTTVSESDFDSDNALPLSGSMPVKKYNVTENTDQRSELNKLLDNFSEGVNVVFNSDPDFAITSIKRLVRSMHFDLGFMISHMQLPYFVFKGLTDKQKQDYFNEMSKIFDKYAVIAKGQREATKGNESDSNLFSESTDSETSTPAPSTPPEEEDSSGDSL